MPTGNYTLTVTVKGFADYKVIGIAVATGQTVRSDAQLKVASVGEAVEVKAQAATIQTDSSTVQSSVEAQAIDILPNAVSNPAVLRLSPGGRDASRIGRGNHHHQFVRNRRPWTERMERDRH